MIRPTTPWWHSAAGAAAVAVLAAGCMPSRWPEPPSLVRDAADIFSPGAEIAADQRLRQLATEHGVWVFVLTHPRPDPPKVLEEPMGEANEAGVQSVAFIVQADGLAATARNDRAGELQDLLLETGLETSFSRTALELRTADKALTFFVTRVEGILNDQ